MTKSEPTQTIPDNRQEQLRLLAEQPVGKLLWRYALPAVVGMMVMQLYSVIDRIFLGQVVGPAALAGLAITFPVMNIATALGVLVGAGASARVSIFLGQGNEQAARRVLGVALTLTLGLGTAYIALFAIFLDPLLRAFGANAEILPYARDFILFILPGLLLTNMAFSFNNIMRASGFPMRAMITMFIGAGVNILLAPIFIYYFQWGIKGAAVATDIAMAMSTLFVMRHFWRASNGPVTFRHGIYSPSWAVVWGIVGIGAAPCIVNVASCVINIFINTTLMRYGGVDAIAAVGIFVTVTALFVCIVLGICQGMQPIVGFNYGHRQPRRAVNAYWLAVAAATVVTLMGWAVGMFAPRLAARIFVADPALVNLTAHALRTAMVCFWMVGFQVISTTYFQSLGKVGLSIFLSLTRQVLFFLPLLVLLPRWWGADGVWRTFCISDLFATAVTAILIIYSLRRLRRNDNFGASAEIS